jgi:hypothetical protein
MKYLNIYAVSHLLAQVEIPSPENPLLQSQTKEPSLSVQLALR